MTILYRAKHGDCLELMKIVPDNTFHSVVTDPPYGLSFMGKNWDHGIPGKIFWEEILRVAKPGAMLLAFGGTRTHHRLMCAIEDAGWEIRDCLMWLTGQGFPKGHDIHKNMTAKTCKCKGSALPYSHDKAHTEPNTEHNLRSLRETDLPQTVNAPDERGQVLQPRVSEQSPSEIGAASWRGLEGREKSGLEGRGDVLQEEGQLQGHSLFESAGMGVANGASGRLHNGTSASHGTTDRQTFSESGSSPSPEPRSNGQQSEQPGIVAEQQQPQASRSGELCPRCGKYLASSQVVESWRGWNVALKPAYEPIILAMKPIDQNYVFNALKWGVAGLNVDGCRIEGNVPGTTQGQSVHAGMIYGADQRTLREFSPHTNGRWPANVLLDEDAAMLLDEQSGVSKSVVSTRKKMGLSVGNGITLNRYQMNQDNVGGYSDSGGASRFFYVAKASKRDRDDGLEGMEEHKMGRNQSSLDGEAMLTGSGNQRSNTKVNHHPTVKPTDLMRYLVRLVTPPNGIVFDPFMGSGSTGRAALLENFRFYGIEKEAEYVEIAEKRIQAVLSDGDRDEN